MRIDLVRRAVNDVHATAVRHPARFPGRKVLIRVRDSAVVLFLVLILRSIGSGIAPQPELLNELVAFLIVGKLFESRQLLRSNDPAHVLVQPLFVGGTQFLLEGLGVGLLLLIGKRALQWIALAGGRSCAGVRRRRRGGSGRLFRTLNLSRSRGRGSRSSVGTGRRGGCAGFGGTLGWGGSCSLGGRPRNRHRNH